MWPGFCTQAEGSRGRGACPSSRPRPSPRAVTALLAVVTGLALLLQHIGFNGGDPSLRDALIYTAQSTLSLDAMKALADHVSWAGDVLRIVLRLSGPLLLGLALLSIRNRVKR
jgi:hypothetical protein